MAICRFGKMLLQPSATGSCIFGTQKITAMANSISQKLRIKEGTTLLTFHAPQNFEEHLQPLPENVTISSNTKTFQQVHWFVTNSKQLGQEVDEIIKLINGDITCWIYYPKCTSKLQTDLTRDKGWEALLKHDEMQWLSLISFDETWSAFSFRQKTVADKKKTSQLKVREIVNYVDAEKKTVRLPDDFAEALKNKKEAQQFLETLSFTNKKEYVEWIITAKRKETRSERLTASIERLEKGWKNPRNT
jgi:hypothetical protein